MTEQERIKRLAEWMGWKFVMVVGEPHIVDPNPNMPPGFLDWNPIQQIQDAWGLLGKIARLPTDKQIEFREIAKEILPVDIWWAMSESLVCEAICATIEKLIEGEKE